LRFCFAALIAVVLPCTASSQNAASRGASTIPVSVRFVATRAHDTAGTTSFFLIGGAADAAVRILPGFSAVAEVAGTTVARVPGTSRGLSTITLLAGPRFTQPLRHFSVSAQALFGAVRGFDADFTTGTNRADTSTAFGFAAGGFVEVPLTYTLSLRAVQVDYLQTQLPNGADNRQGDVRVGAGVVFHVSLPSRR
jgi:hypothetical protein